MTVVPFRAKTDQPSHVDQLLTQGDFQGVEELLANGLKATTPVRNIIAFEAVLMAWRHHHPCAENDPGLTPPIPESLAQALIQADLPQDEIEPGRTAISYALFYGQWDLALRLHQLGYAPEGSKSMLDYILQGSSARLGILHAHAFLPNDVEIEFDFMEHQAGPAERAQLEKIVTWVKPLTKFWPQNHIRPFEANSAVSLSVISRHNVFLDVLLSHGAHPDALSTISSDGRLVYASKSNALCAIETDNAKGLEILMRHGAHYDTSWVNTNQLSLLQCAALLGRVECLDALWPHVPDTIKSYDTVLAMMNAAHSGALPALDWFVIEKGISPFVETEPTGYTLLHQAALAGNVDTINHLLGYGLSWDHAAQNGVTPASLLLRDHPDLARAYQLSHSKVTLFKRK